MAWVAPRTWVTAEVVSASLLNTHVRDNLLETAPAKAAAAGDLVYATGANAIAVLSLGTKGQHVVTNDAETAPAWSSGVDIIDRDMSQQESVSSTSLDVMYTHSVPADILGLTGGLRLTMAGDMLDNANANLRLRVKFGATTVLDSGDNGFTNTTDRYKWLLTVIMFNTSATAQKWGGSVIFSSGVNQMINRRTDETPAALAGGSGTSAEDTTGALTLEVSVQWDTSSASLSFRKEMAFLERLAA